MIGKKYILAAALACAPFATQAAETVYTFDSVTGIEHRQNEVRIKGILLNHTTPTTVVLPWWTLPYHYEHCPNVFNVVLSQPAAFTLTVVTELVTEPPMHPGAPPMEVLHFRGCSADRKP